MLAYQIAPRPPRRSATRVPFPDYLSLSREPDLHKHLRTKVLEAMRLLNTRQADLVQRTGIPRSTISAQLQSGKFDVEVLYKVARALSMDVGDFFPKPTERKLTPERCAEVLKKVETAIEWGRRGRG